MYTVIREVTGRPVDDSAIVKYNRHVHHVRLGQIAPGSIGKGIVGEGCKVVDLEGGTIVMLAVDDNVGRIRTRYELRLCPLDENMHVDGIEALKRTGGRADQKRTLGPGQMSQVNGLCFLPFCFWLGVSRMPLSCA